MQLYQTAVIGKGLFGAAAAKYLQAAGNKTILTGPNEPHESEYKNTTVFASHYDAGRVTRLYGKSKEWTLLNKLTQNKFAAIQAESGIAFYETEGSLFVSTKEKRDYIDGVINHQIKPLDNETVMLNDDELKNKFPQFHFPDESIAYFEKGNSGHLKPGKLIEAQLKIFLNNGGIYLPQLTQQVKKENNSFIIFTNEGEEISAEEVLVCTGAFHNFFNFITAPQPLILKSETILLAELNKEDAMQMQQLPSLIYDITTDEYDEIYLVKPLLYPDGKYYLKIGANLTTDKIFHSLEEIKKWFCAEPSKQQQLLYESILKDLIPSLPIISFKTKHCIIERTVSGNPIINKSPEGVYTCTGGNGYGAMCSDAMGFLAANTIMEKPLPAGFSNSFFEE